MPNLVVILPMMRIQNGRLSAILFDIFNIFAQNFKTNRDRDFVFVSKKGFWGMPNLLVIFPMMSDTKWLTGGHFV